MKLFQWILPLLLISLTALPPSTMAAEWVWTTPTKGAPNTTASIEEDETSEDTTSTVPTSTTFTIGDVYISEVLPNPAGPDQGKEWIELHNISASPIDPTQLLLKKSNGATYSFSGQALLPPHSYTQLLLPGSFALPNTGNTLELLRKDTQEVLFAMTYPTAKDDDHFSVFCTSYQPLQCTTEQAPATPNAANERSTLTITPSHETGTYSKGFTFSLTPSHSEANIWYSTSPFSQEISHMERYTERLTVDTTTELWFFSQLNERTGPIEYVRFHFPESTPSAAINEVRQDFVELSLQDPGTYLLSNDPQCQVHCMTIEQQDPLAQHRFASTPGNTIYLRTIDGTLMDLFTVPLEPTAPTWGRIPSNPLLLRRSTWAPLQHIIGAFAPSQLSTPGKPNLFFLPKGQASESLGEDGLPVSFKLRYNLSPDTTYHGEIHNVFLRIYQQELGRFVNLTIEGSQVSGTMPQGHTIQLLHLGHPTPLGQGSSDNKGQFSFTISTEPTPTHYLIKDRNGTSSGPLPIYSTPSLTPPPFALLSLPNPPGSDKKEQEWIGLYHQGVEPFLMSDYVIQHQQHTYTIPPILLHPNEILLITGDILGFSIINNKGAITLSYHENAPISSIHYDTAKDGEILYSDPFPLSNTLGVTYLDEPPSAIANNPQEGTSSTNTASTTAAFLKPSTPLTIPTAPTLSIWPQPKNPSLLWFWILLTIGSGLGALSTLHHQWLTHLFQQWRHLRFPVQYPIPRLVEVRFSSHS